VKNDTCLAPLKAVPSRWLGRILLLQVIRVYNLAVTLASQRVQRVPVGRAVRLPYGRGPKLQHVNRAVGEAELHASGVHAAEGGPIRPWKTIPIGLSRLSQPEFRSQSANAEPGKQKSSLRIGSRRLIESPEAFAEQEGITRPVRNRTQFVGRAV